MSIVILLAMHLSRRNYHATDDGHGHLTSEEAVLS